MTVSPLTIGPISVRTPLLLAPMAGVTDYPFRRLCKAFGAGLVYSEFVSAEGIIRENQRTLDLIRFDESERPIGVQIFGSRPEAMFRAARVVAERFRPDLIDINYGCPVPKVTIRGAGSAALRNLGLMKEITAAVIEGAAPLPVTVKMRAGWNASSIVVPEAGVLLQEIGVRAITLHPRTTCDAFGSTADWSRIRDLKAAVAIPVIGNGDVEHPEDVSRMFRETGCDGVMVGRGALGNPWFFREAIEHLATGAAAKPSPQERVSVCLQHLDWMLEEKGEVAGLNLMRKHFGWYVKGFPNAADHRRALVTAKDADTARLELLRLSALQMPREAATEAISRGDAEYLKVSAEEAL